MTTLWSNMNSPKCNSGKGKKIVLSHDYEGVELLF